MMLRFYEFSDSFTKLGFCTATIANGLFIYLTLFHIRRITGTYKLMVLTFAVLGITFSGWELIARPFVHNFNKGFVFFSLNSSSRSLQKFLQVSLAVYAGFYAILLAFIAVMFLFRYVSLLSDSSYSKKFGGFGIILWMLWPIVAGGIYGGALLLCTMPDSYADGYFEEEMLKTYYLAIRETPRLTVISYDPDDSFRWRNISFLITGTILLSIQYLIILYCGVQMRAEIQKELQNFSVLNRKLQKQFFRALMVQIIAPTILFILPSTGVLLTPFLDIPMSVQSGGIFALFSLYIPFDSLAFMLIVSEYRKVIKKFFKTSRIPRFSKTSESLTIESSCSLSTSTILRELRGRDQSQIRAGPIP